MVIPVSTVRRVRVPVLEMSQDAQLSDPVPVVARGHRTLAMGDGSLAALRRPSSLGASAAVSTPAAVPGTMPDPRHSDADLTARESHWHARTPSPVARLEVQLPAQGEESGAWHTQSITHRHAGTGTADRSALGRAVETLLAFPYVVFDETSLITELLPRYASDAPVVSASLALEWLLAGQVSSDPDVRLQRLNHAIVEGLVIHQELMEGLRNLGSRLQVGGVIRAADRDLALRLNLLLSTEAAVVDAAAREMSDMLRNSAHTFHLLLLTGGALPRPVACIRESDELFSVFDPTRGIFAAAGDDLQALIAGIAAEHELRLLQQRECGDLRQALSILHNAQLMEVAMHGVDIDHDGIRDGGLI
ncbi:hypothetical protein [Xylophilus ampelinus]|uniref:Uncharacterized protein n=1 Tax=Xylophilus ampelinus TaxID=54067 RepID=A0A318SGG0_9BURK|nr:hypothetical protein [Xylophilus ampelinus]MCS4510408.1 hypothetical protein [Xylophilus ampelinus]PYE77862.1 hypothetical protein DFQ15_1116 [Xylophilus ampelinus]